MRIILLRHGQYKKAPAELLTSLGYSGESTMSYLTQLLGLTVQNFVSAATGIAVAVA